MIFPLVIIGFLLFLSESLKFFSSFSQLTELALLYCQKIVNSGLLRIGQSCKFLQALHLVDCSRIGDEAICGIAEGCRNLKKLHIRRCYEVGLPLSLSLVYHINHIYDYYRS